MRDGGETTTIRLASFSSLSLHGRRSSIQSPTATNRVKTRKESSPALTSFPAESRPATTWVLFDFLASRGLIPIHLSVSHRLPLFENTLDIVHSMHVLSNWIPDNLLEFTVYDIYWVLRPGGLFWLDRFFFLGSQLNETYVPMLDRIGLTNYDGMPVPSLIVEKIKMSGTFQPCWRNQ